jgi:hypothetical protein
MPQLNVNRIASLGGTLRPLAPKDPSVLELLDRAGHLTPSAMRAHFGPERLEPRGRGLPAVPFWSFTLPATPPARPRGLLRVSFPEQTDQASWEYQEDEAPALVLAGIVIARLLRR